MEQRTAEWFQIRGKKLTASHADVIAVAGKGLETYIRQVVAEYISPSEPFENEHTIRGKELEATARGIYTLETGNEVTEVGFVQAGEYIGTSPDGLVGEVGGLEIKCPSNKVFLDYLLDETIPKDYWYQCQMNMLVTDRQWWDLMFYNPNFKQSFIINRVYADEEAFNSLMKGLEIGVKRLQETLEVATTTREAIIDKGQPAPKPAIPLTPENQFEYHKELIKSLDEKELKKAIAALKKLKKPEASTNFSLDQIDELIDMAETRINNLK